MRVGLVTGIFPPDIGGPATYVAALGMGLTERGHAVEVITYSDARGHRADWPFVVRRIGRTARARRAQAVLEIARLARRSDVLLVAGLVEAATIANGLARRPCVVRVVGDSAWERARNRGLTTQEFGAFQRAEHASPIAGWQRRRTRCLRRARVVVVPSEFLRTVVAGWGAIKRIDVIPNGVSDEFLRATEVVDLDALRAAHDLPARFLLYAGRLTNWKGCDTLIRVLPRLPGDVGVVIVGDGPERAALGGIAERLRLVERVRFLPAAGRATVAGLMRLAACVVLNSGYEGHPHVVLEAMAVGAPVAAAAECGTRELVVDGDNGLLFEKDNSPQIVAALGRILDDAALRQRLVEGGKAAARRFPWSATLDRTEALLQELVGKRT
jgi:glycosyltransferase involved in cell wall biosynthesis